MPETEETPKRVKHTRPHPNACQPTIDDLMAWEADGGCEACCEEGCWVEPDGYCPHGYPSWLIVMGLI